MESRAKYIIISGNPIEGFNAIGPFSGAQDVSEYADQIRDNDWWLMDLSSPTEGNADHDNG